MKKSLSTFCGIIWAMLAVFSISGCEKLLTRTIEVNVPSEARKVSVTAILSCYGDTGSLSLAIRQRVSLNEYERRDQFYGTEDFRRGTVSIYQGEQVIFQKTDLYDIAKNEPLMFYGLPLHENLEYRLEVNIEGFEIATAKTVMPSAPPKIDKASITRRDLNLNNCYYHDGHRPYTLYGGEIEYFTINCLLPPSNAEQPQYYAFIASDLFTKTQHGFYTDEETSEQVEFFRTKKDESIKDESITHTGLFSQFYIFDSPYYDLMVSLMDVGDPYDAFFFKDLVLDNEKLKGESQLEILVEHFALWENNATHERNENRLLEKDAMEYIDSDSLVFESRRISEETYRHALSLEKQYGANMLFDEPYFIYSNIENGIGIFSAQNVERVVLKVERRYSYR